MPPQPLSHGLLYPLLKGVHVHRQKKAVHQALGNMTPFTFLPYPYTSIRKEQLAIQLEYGLPCLRCSGRGCHARPDLSLWLLNDNTPWWLGRSLGYNISQTDRDLLGNTLPLSGSTGGRKRRGSRLTSALRWLLLRGLPCAGYKTINGHGLSGHHVSTTIRFNVRGVNKLYSYLLDFPSGSLGFNKFFGLGGFFLNGSLILNRCMS